MKLTQFMPAMLAVSFLFMGCGGGGGGSSKPPSSSTTASSVSSSSSLPISSSSSSKSVATALTIQGVLANAHLANADVKIRIGDQVFTAKADAQQKYRIELPVENKNKSVPMQLTAKGNGNASAVEFAALLPSENALSALAGSDKVLTADEYFGVNVSTLSTAEYAQVNNMGITVSSDRERENALFTISNFSVLNLAALIQSYAASENVLLPDGITTTLALALDSDLSESYITLDNIGLGGFLDVRTDPLQNKKPSAFKSGKYFVESGDQNQVYSLTFNADGTGELQADKNFIIWTPSSGVNSVKSPFAWVQSDDVLTLTFNSLSLTKNSGLWLPTGEACEVAATEAADECEIKLATLAIEIIAEREEKSYLLVRPTLESFRNGALIPGAQVAYNFGSTLFQYKEEFSADELLNADWVTNSYRYQFLTKSTGHRKNFLTGAEESFSWSVIDGYLSINLLDTKIWPIKNGKSGFNIIYSESANPTLPVMRRELMIKRQLLSLVENDWKGRWISLPLEKSTSFFDVNPGQIWAQGFQPSSGSWSLAGASRLTAISSGWQYDYDLLAVDGSINYIHSCASTSSPAVSLSSCVINLWKKTSDPTIASFGRLGNTPTVFSEPATGKYLLLNSNGIYEGVSNMIGEKMEYQRVSASRLFVKDTVSIVELMSSDINGVTLCEYQVGKSCDTGVKRIMELGLGVKLNVTGSGTIFHKFFTARGSIQTSISGWVMLPKNHNQVLSLVPASGYTVTSESVSGCGGSLDGYEYNIPGRLDACEINIAFVSK